MKSITDSLTISVPVHLEDSTDSHNRSLNSQGGDEFQGELFPLPLTSFERLMLDDDHAGYPRIFVVVVELSGELQRAAFEQSIHKVVRRNPLLSATIRKLKSKLHWVPTAFPDHHITWGDHTFEQENTSFNLRKTPGFRVCGRTDGLNSEIRLVFHHAVTDGHGTRRVILDILSHYAAIVTPDAKIAPLDRLDYKRLRDRGEINPKKPIKNESLSPATRSSFTQRLKTIYEFFSQQPTPIRPGRARILQKKSQERCLTHIRSSRLTVQEVNCCRDRLRGTGITLNDLAIALLLNSIARWNRERGESGKDRLYRILVPVDLRESGDELLPAANRLSFIFITRHTGLCLDLPRLISTVRAEMDYIDEHELKSNLLKALPVVQAIPGLIPIGARVPLCLSTAVLTNMGDNWRKLRHRFPEDEGRIAIGNLRFIRAGGTPPLRPGTGLGIGMTMSYGEILIQGQFDSRLFAPSDAEEFMNLFLDRWRNWAVEGQIQGKPLHDFDDCSS